MCVLKFTALLSLLITLTHHFSVVARDAAGNLKFEAASNHVTNRDDVITVRDYFPDVRNRIGNLACGKTFTDTSVKLPVKRNTRRSTKVGEKMQEVAAELGLIRRSKFQPWGGKRSADVVELETRNTFQPWGGKRSVDAIELETRNTFQPWGGKRSAYNNIDSGKRNIFQPWGGKRETGLTESEAFEMSKRNTFQPWGGKRTDAFKTGKRNTFQPWGGKRNDGVEHVETEK